MTTNNLFAVLIFTAIFISTFSASVAVAQMFAAEKPAQSDSFFPTGIAGAWHFNVAESDDVLTKIGELLTDRNAAPIDEKSDAKQSEQPAISISIFAPDALILSNGDSEDRKSVV